METVWIARVHVSARTASKIGGLHRLDVDEVRDAVERQPGLTVSWDEHPERGLRALVYVTIRDRRVLVVLYPAGDVFDEEFNLGSAPTTPSYCCAGGGTLHL